MQQSDFEATAAETLEKFMDRIDEALGDRLDVDLDGGVLTIELASGAQYVISKHSPSRQVWVSSPISGATHFAYDADSGDWLNTRGDGALKDILSRELEKVAGTPFRL